jgi:hypothetical protein
VEPPFAFKTEKLDLELRPHLQKCEGVGLVLKHPLVFSIPHFPKLNSYANLQLKAKRKALAEARSKQFWEQYVWLYERPFRVDALQEIERLLSDGEFWKLVAEIWIDSENVRELPDVWDEILRSSRGCRENLMHNAEQTALAAMPERIVIFQGHTVRRDDGWSWTTNRDTAIWFAERFAELERTRPAYTTATVDKSDVLAFFSRRSESEILVERRYVQDAKTETLR